MEMEKQQYVKPTLTELDMPMFVTRGCSPTDSISPIEYDTEGEETPGEEE